MSGLFRKQFRLYTDYFRTRNIELTCIKPLEEYILRSVPGSTRIQASGESAFQRITSLSAPWFQPVDKSDNYGYWLCETTPAMENTGRYMAITIPPQTPPRNTIMIGSISCVRPSTAASTSSS